VRLGDLDLDESDVYRSRGFVGTEGSNVVYGIATELKDQLGVRSAAASRD